MTAEQARSWHEANQRYLTAALAVVRALLERHAARALRDAGAPALEEQPVSLAEQALRQAAEEMPSPAALDTLSAAFALSPFERQVLLLCAGVELDSNLASLCGTAQGDARRVCPTFSLALAALPGAHWSALTPAAPLRRWRMIALAPGESLTLGPLRIDERVLHYLSGVSYLDDRLRGTVERVPALPASPREPGAAGESAGPSAEPYVPPSQRGIAERIARTWSRPQPGAGWPAIQLYGEGVAGKQAIAAWACARLGLQLYRMRAVQIPTAADERETLARLWEREAALSGSALLLDCDEVDSAEARRAVAAFVRETQGMIVLASRDPLSTGEGLTIRLLVPGLSAEEQRRLWQQALGPAAQELNGQLDGVVTQFNLSLPGIQAVSAEMLGGPDDEGRSVSRLWDACRVQARPRLEDMAQRIEPVATWNDLVLPEGQMQTLRDLAAQVRQRARVYGAWGFASKSARGLGISALFAGASGTGKTMAAEVLANELRLDLYRIDLSQVVSKYIGETEKNLRRVFDAAEEGGAILLFDEADALFGRRSEVKDSHDRYANIEVSYLLQRMECYRGLAILTTNMKQALDPAFLRRIRFIVPFPFPDAAQRAEIWRRIFPAATPTHELHSDKLARLNVAGGNIHNIAMHAAFLAAEAGEAVGMPHLLRAARREYAKLEKALTEAEIGGWA